MSDIYHVISEGLKKLLDDTNNGLEKYKAALSAPRKNLFEAFKQFEANPWKRPTLKEGNTDKLSKFFEEFPAILHFFISELKNKDSILERVDNAYSIFLDTRAKVSKEALAIRPLLSPSHLAKILKDANQKTLEDNAQTNVVTSASSQKSSSTRIELMFRDAESFVTSSEEKEIKENIKKIETLQVLLTEEQNNMEDKINAQLDKTSEIEVLLIDVVKRYKKNPDPEAIFRIAYLP